MRIYLFGNGNLSLDDFLAHYRGPLSRLDLSGDVAFIVCDFRGADTLAMEYLKHITPNVRVFHMGQRPRYLPDRHRTRVSQWELVGGFESDEARDAAAIAACTHFLAHDTASSVERMSATGRNIERCLELGKIRLD